MAHPAVHSARFAGPDATGESNNRLLLAKLEGTPQRNARFVTAISLARNGVVLQTTTGTAEGEILASHAAHSALAMTRSSCFRLCSAPLPKSARLKNSPSAPAATPSAISSVGFPATPFDSLANRFR